MAKHKSTPNFLLSIEGCDFLFFQSDIRMLVWTDDRENLLVWLHSQVDEPVILTNEQGLALLRFLEPEMFHIRLNQNEISIEYSPALYKDLMDAFKHLPTAPFDPPLDE